MQARTPHGTFTLHGARVALLLSVAACGTARIAPGPPVTPKGPPDYLTTYIKGETFASFLDHASSRRDEWRRQYNDAVVPADLVSRMRQLPDRRLILVVAEAWCSDSVNSVPYVARLVDGAPERLALRIIDSTAGRSVMNANRTPDGRSATPTLVVLRENGDLMGSWVERPRTTQVWFLERRKTMAYDAVHAELLKWYAEDAGRTTMSEIAALLEE
jgi:hypothetical protein